MTETDPRASRSRRDLGPLAEVRHEQDGDRSTLVLVRELRHPRERVWAALTDPDQLRRWAPFEPDRDLAAPGPVTLRMIDGQAVEEHPSEVRRSEAPGLLQHTWGDDLLTWELEPVGTGTRLTLRHAVGGAEWVPRTAAGWHLCLVVMDRLLAGEAADPVVGAAAREHGWSDLHDAYAERLGIAGAGWPEGVFEEGEGEGEVTEAT